MRVHHSLWISSLCSSPRVLVCDSRRGLTQHTAESSSDGCQGNVKPFLQDSSLLATAKDTHLLSITLDIWLHLHEQAQGGGVETCKNMYCTLSVRKRDGLSGREGNESKNTKQRKEERSPAVFRSTERERERERDWDLKSLQSAPLHPAGSIPEPLHILKAALRLTQHHYVIKIFLVILTREHRGVLHRPDLNLNKHRNQKRCVIGLGVFFICCFFSVWGRMLLSPQT